MPGPTEHAINIAELKTRVDGHDETLARYGVRLDKQDDSITSLRESMAQVATRDDVAVLRDAIHKQFFEQLKAAQESIPAKIAAFSAIFSVLIGAAGFLLGHYKG